MKNIKIVHFCQDEKWTKGAYYLFEKAFPGQNKYIVLKNQANKAFKYIHFLESIIEINADKHESLISQNIHDASLVVLHGLTYRHALIAYKIIPEKKILWLIMGADMYKNPYIYNKPILGRKTKELKDRIENSFYLIDEIKHIYRWIRYGKPLDQNEAHKFVAHIASKIQFVATFQKEQFDMLKELTAIPDNAERLHFSFYPLEVILNHNESINISGKNILLGNSASYTNNHLEIIDRLAEFDLNERKIIAPLSYGPERYGKQIVKYGYKKLCNHFYPLNDFLPVEEYTNIIQTCGIAIMNHYRGEAAGNVLRTIYLGSKLYMSERSIIFKYLKRIGCYVFSIEKELKPSNKDALLLLNEKQIQHNRKVIHKEISERVLLDCLNKSIHKKISQEKA